MIFVHVPNEAIRSHVRPVLIYVVEASSAAVRFMGDRPTLRHIDEGGPQRMLTLVVYQNVIHAVFILEWICHLVLLCVETVEASSRAVMIWPTFAAGPASIMVSWVHSTSKISSCPR